MKMIEIFRTGDIEYPDKGHDKPVRFRKEDFEEIIKATQEVNLTDGHTNKVLAQLNNFKMVDNKLCADISEELDLTGKGISPRFEFSTIDKGDYLVPCDIKLIDAGVTKNPRSKIYVNTGDDGMSDREQLIKDIQKNNEEIRSQRERIGVLKSKNEKLENSLKETKGLKKQLDEKTEELEKLKKSSETWKSKAEAYDKIEDEKRQKLIKELANDDEQAKERFSKMGVDDLEFLVSQKVLTNKPKGVGENDAPGINDGSQKIDPEEGGETTNEDYQKWKKENGVR